MPTTDVFDMAATWNDAGTVFTALKMDVEDTASDSASLLYDFQVGGVSKVRANKAGHSVAEQFQVYKLFTDESNYERGVMKWNGNDFLIAAESAGTGANRELVLKGSSATSGSMRFKNTIVVAEYGLGLAQVPGAAHKGGFYAEADNVIRVHGIATSWGGVFSFPEVNSLPATPSANYCRVYAKDNGAGKTQYVVLMPDGIETVLATET